MLKFKEFIAEKEQSFNFKYKGAKAPYQVLNIKAKDEKEARKKLEKIYKQKLNIELV